MATLRKVGALALAALALILTTSLASAGGRDEGGYWPAIGGYNWSGLYVGGSLGWAGTSTDWRYTHPAPANCCAPVSSDENSGIAGIHIGLQHQFGQIVLGVEAAVSNPNIFGDDFQGKSGCIIGDPRGCDTHVGAIATVGGRVGYAFNNTLLFIGGGYATANIKSRLQTFDQDEARHDGWYIGGGIEYALMPNVIVGLEYQHIEFDTVEHQPTSGLANFRNIDADVDVVRARLSFKLGRDEPRPAPLK